MTTSNKVVNDLGQSIETKLYDQDYFLWLEQTAQKLRNRELEKVDLDNLVEELEDMGRSEKNAVESNLEILLLHLLKYKYQPEKRSKSWMSSIFEHRKRLRKAFKNSPSLRRHFESEFEQCYVDSRKKAAIETGLAIDIFPDEVPFTREQVLDEDFIPEN